MFIITSVNQGSGFINIRIYKCFNGFMKCKWVSKFLLTLELINVS